MYWITNSHKEYEKIHFQWRSTSWPGCWDTFSWMLKFMIEKFKMEIWWVLGLQYWLVMMLLFPIATPVKKIKELISITFAYFYLLFKCVYENSFGIKNQTYHPITFFILSLTYDTLNLTMVTAFVFFVSTFFLTNLWVSDISFNSHLNNL